MTMFAVRLFLLYILGFAPGAVAQPLEHACDAAAARAERDWHVPAGVLSAVGTVESGRYSGASGAAPWPYTINAAGKGSFFETKQEAIEAVLALMRRGYPYIDIGCFQIDIAFHAGTFRSLDEAFDPEQNAQAAAKILAETRQRTPDWATAVAYYHSATPKHGGPYLQRVRAALPAAQIRGLNAQFLVERASIDPPPVLSPQSSTPLPKVIYPAAETRVVRVPQIIFIGAVSPLPRILLPPSTPAKLRP